MTAVVWLALDGVGHPLDAPVGSAWEQDLPTLRPLIDAGLALDATLGVLGLPQSGTGQTCWLTGQNAVQVMGEHFGPHPGPTLQKMLRGQSLPVRLAQAGAKAALVNHYAPEYLAAQGTRNRMGCFPFSFRAAGWPLNPPHVPALRVTLGLDFQEPWAPLQPLSQVQSAGQALGRAAQEYDLLVADLWFSDLIGHLGRAFPAPQVNRAAHEYLKRLDALLLGLLHNGTRVIISSDHGNFENLHVKSHTTARVPFAGTGIDLRAAANVVQGGQVIRGLFGLDLLPSPS